MCVASHQFFIVFWCEGGACQSTAESLVSPSAQALPRPAGKAVWHLNLSLGMLRKNSLHNPPLVSFVSTGHFLQRISNRWLPHSLRSDVFWVKKRKAEQKNTLLVPTLFFKPFELMLLLCLTLGLPRGAMLSTWPLELVTLQCVMLPYALHVFQD